MFNWVKKILRFPIASSIDKKIVTFNFFNYSVLLFFIVTLLRTIYINYSNVPFGDQWDSWLAMNPELDSLKLSSFWQQHNEHRMFLGKILFYFDFLLFNGNAAPLIIANILIVLTTLGFFFIYIWKISSIRFLSVRNALGLSAAIGVLLLSTMQNENFSWAFQGTFFLASLLPFTAFIAGFKFVQTQAIKYFLLSWAISFGAMGTLASGLLVSACLVLMYLIAHQRKKLMFISIGLTSLQFLVYFYRYREAHSSPISVLVHNPEFIAKYVSLYLGSPTLYIFNEINKPLVIILTLIYICTVSIVFIRTYKRNNSPLSATVIPFTMAIYIFCVAILSAGGRFEFGLLQATSSRYTTMSLTGWCCILLLAADLSKKKDTYFFTILPLILGLLLFPQQTNNLTISNNTNFERQVAALALELNIDDKPQLLNIYPDPKKLTEFSKILINKRQSIFGESKFADAKKLIGTRIKLNNLEKCQGYIDENLVISSSTKNKKISGWIYDGKIQKVPQAVVTLNSMGEINGYGFTGSLRPDVSSAIGKDAVLSGFRIYADSKPIEVVVGIQKLPTCYFKIK
jgi:hypothetical protein